MEEVLVLQAYAPLNLPTISEGEQGQGATKHQGDCVERYAIKGGCPLHADWGRFVFYRFPPPALLLLSIQ